MFGVSSSYASAIRRSGGTLLEAAQQTVRTRHRVPLIEEEITKEWLRQTLPVNSGSRSGAHVQRESDDDLYKRYKDQFQHLLLLIANEFDEEDTIKNSRLNKILQFVADKLASDDQRQALLMGMDSRLGLQSPVLSLRRLPQDQRVSIFQLIFSFIAPSTTFHPLPLSRKTFSRIKKQIKISKSAVYWGQFYCLVCACSRSLTCLTRHSHMRLLCVRPCQICASCEDLERKIAALPDGKEKRKYRKYFTQALEHKEAVIKMREHTNLGLLFC
jgi:hypothetical protein